MKREALDGLELLSFGFDFCDWLSVHDIYLVELVVIPTELRSVKWMLPFSDKAQSPQGSLQAPPYNIKLSKHIVY